MHHKDSSDAFDGYGIGDDRTLVTSNEEEWDEEDMSLAEDEDVDLTGEEEEDEYDDELGDQ